MSAHARAYLCSLLAIGLCVGASSVWAQADGGATRHGARPTHRRGQDAGAPRSDAARGLWRGCLGARVPKQPLAQALARCRYEPIDAAVPATANEGSRAVAPSSEGSPAPGTEASAAPAAAEPSAGNRDGARRRNRRSRGRGDPVRGSPAPLTPEQLRTLAPTPGEIDTQVPDVRHRFVLPPYVDETGPGYHTRVLFPLYFRPTAAMTTGS